MQWGTPLSRGFFDREVTQVARDLLGRVIVGSDPENPIAVRLTEVEAYAGPRDPASHAYRGPTPRTAVMFGRAGHLYTYLVYGMHWCANIVTGPDGVASAVLLRSGEVVAGHSVARGRRPAGRRDDHLARGPAGLTTVLGWNGSHNGIDLCAPESAYRLYEGSPVHGPLIRTGPRVGVAAAADWPWRFWHGGSPSVSAYRSGTRAQRRHTGSAAPKPGRPEADPRWQDVGRG